MEYQPFLEPIPTYQSAVYEIAWFERYDWADDPVAAAVCCALAMVVVPIAVFVACFVVLIIGLIFGASLASVLDVVFITSLCFAALCALATVGLLVYRFAVLPGRERPSERFDQAVDAWRQRRLDHVMDWEQRLGWPAA
ncbi:MAG: hypothetical protein ACRDRW_16645 [Pseudonocardiaceae bacterium]